MRDLLTVEQRNTRRLAKIHKLKRENRTLSSQRKTGANLLKEVNNSYLSAVVNVFANGGDIAVIHRQRQQMIDKLTNRIFRLSEKIGKNSAKIQRLRTLISQDNASTYNTLELRG